MGKQLHYQKQSVYLTEPEQHSKEILEKDRTRKIALKSIEVQNILTWAFGP